MPSINIDLDFYGNPKIIRFMNRIGSGWEGLLLRLWIYKGKFRPESERLTQHSATEIERAICWWGKPGEAIKALVEVGLLDELQGGEYAVHDWLEHGGHIAAYKERAKKGRMAKLAQVQKGGQQEVIKQSSSGASGRLDGSTVQHSTAQHITSQENNSLRVQKAHVRESSKTTSELQTKDFILRCDRHEFELFLQRVRDMIRTENKPRPHNPFLWEPPLISFESDLKGLIYRIKDEKKITILTEALNVLHFRYNWPEYVLLAIKATVRASLRKKVESPYKFAYALLHKPNELVSAASDGNLSKPIAQIVELAGGKR